jgi:hypothetical protein
MGEVLHMGAVVHLVESGVESGLLSYMVEEAANQLPVKLAFFGVPVTVASTFALLFVIEI